MRTFYISVAVFIAIVAWLLNKPIPKQSQVARAFTDAEVEYIEKSFDYAMDTLKPDEHFDWSVAGVNARISASSSFVSSQKADCRYYVEVMRTADDQRTENGIACKRTDEDGWCRVVGDNVPQSCALEKTASQEAKRARFAIMQGVQVVDEMLGGNVSVSGDGLAPSRPGGISGPGFSPVEKPDLKPSDFRPPMFWEKEKQ